MAYPRRRQHGRSRLHCLIIPVSGTILLFLALLSFLAPSPVGLLHHHRLYRSRHILLNSDVHNASIIKTAFDFPTDGRVLDRDLWTSRSSNLYFGCSNSSRHFAKAESVTHSNRYLLIATSGGLNQQRTGITDAVVAARILNSTLVVPKLDQKSFWKDSSTFSEVFNVDWFISFLSKDVKIIKQLPKVRGSRGRPLTPHTMRVPRKCNVKCYQSRLLPVLMKKHAVQLTKFDYRLSNRLETDLQKLRCRVNYHALKFTDPILEMGRTLVQRMRMKSKHYIALHLRLAVLFFQWLFNAIWGKLLATLIFLSKGPVFFPESFGMEWSRIRIVLGLS